jgi:hypothetical protein
MNSAVLFGERAPRSPVIGHTAALSTTLIWAVLAVGLMLSPLSDFLSVRALHGATGQGGDARFSLLVRGAMVFGLLGAMVWGGKVRLSGLRIAMLVIAPILSASVVYALGDMSGSEFVEQAIFVLKIFSFFVYLAALSGLSARRLAKLESIVYVSLLVYAMAIVAGAAFSIEMFRSYQADTQIRSGYKGIVFAQNEASSLMIVGLAFGYLRVLRFGWRLRDTLLVVSLLAASMLVGTKGAAVGALGVTCAYFYSRHSVFKATLNAGAMIGLIAGVAMLSYLFIPAIQQAADLSIGYFNQAGGHFEDNKLLTVLLSGRNLKFANVWDGLGRQDYVALLTGGYPLARSLVEIDIPDLVLALGLPIAIAYFVMLYGVLVHHGRRLATSRFSKLFFFVLIAVAASAGHELGSAVITPYLAVIAIVIKRCVAPGVLAGEKL